MTYELDSSIAQELIVRATGMAASEYARPICVAICDDNGFLVAFLREPKSPMRSIAIAQSKAYTAARMSVETAAFHERLLRERLQLGDFCDERLTSLPGGAPIHDHDGRLIGAIGVSGLTADQDQTIATGVSREWSRKIIG
ncbi:GlcG/HbpS family heme-binding protein [Burkholderia lata]|uniref:GlcG/HbpS family heme-binding protein n=1 Tax=Burkholderia lata (strain ATCC 17760 / DSM 23089 / LMG 22485 / NCIMB 9086 / R18194 / 383) TaxID=482957 RepID=UPI0009F6FEC3|nr:heme-binding protein [Burkholderia lata]